MSDPLTSSALGSSTQGPFRLERHGPLAELVLSRPARHNAFDADLMLGLLDCLDDLAHLHGHDLAERPQPSLHPLQSVTPLIIQDCWLPTARLLAFLIAPNCFCLPA